MTVNFLYCFLFPTSLKFALFLSMSFYFFFSAVTPVLPSLLWVLWRFTLPFCVSLLSTVSTLKGHRKERLGKFYRVLYSFLHSSFRNISWISVFFLSLKTHKMQLFCPAEPANVNFLYLRQILAFAPNWCPGTLWSPFATCSGPGSFHFKNRDILALRTQATASPQTLGTNSPGPRPVWDQFSSMISTGFFNILIRVILNFLYENVNIWIIFESGFIDY